jgi:transposase
MITIEFTEEEKKALNYERFHHPHPKVQRKMEALWLKSQGESHNKIAKLTGVTVNMITRYIKEYQAGGIERLKQLNFYRKHSELDAHTETIEKDLQDHPPSTVKEAMDRIEKLTGLKRSEVQISKFLKRIGVKRRKVGMIPAKADIQKQADFKKNSGAASARS